MSSIEEFLSITDHDAYNKYGVMELILISQGAFREMVSGITELDLRMLQLESKDHIGDGHHFGIPCVFCGKAGGVMLSSTCDSNMPQKAQDDEAAIEHYIDLIRDWGDGLGDKSLNMILRDLIAYARGKV